VIDENLSIVQITLKNDNHVRGTRSERKAVRRTEYMENRIVYRGDAHVGDGRGTSSVFQWLAENGVNGNLSGAQ